MGAPLNNTMLLEGHLKIFGPIFKFDLFIPFVQKFTFVLGFTAHS